MPVSNGNRPALDTKLIACKDLAFFEALTFYNHSWSPLYVNGKIDTLVELDAVGAKELLDYNVMLRKSWSIDVQHKIFSKRLSKFTDRSTIISTLGLLYKTHRPDTTKF